MSQGTTTLSHRPIMVAEVLAALMPTEGDVVVDCTLGGGGHAEAILPLIRPSGKLIGIDVDPVELARTTARLRRAGVSAHELVTRQGSFAELGDILGAEGVHGADIVFADLGISTMQADDPVRGFSYKRVGPLDMRMDQTRGRTAVEYLATSTAAELASALRAHADEPYADEIGALLAGGAFDTTHGLERHVRLGVAAAHPELSKAAIKMSVRRVFQALRIAVNDELRVLEAFLRDAPGVLAPSGRIGIITFHSGEDRLVKRAFRDGHRAGLYSAISRGVTQSSREESFTNRRSRAAKLRWAMRAAG
jgi:16S rRNA (cytosine1402-N4)-methyltransferase